jgi:hypothetical protein
VRTCECYLAVSFPPIDHKMLSKCVASISSCSIRSVVLFNRSNASPSITTFVRFARTTVKSGRKQSHSVGKQSVGAESTPVVKIGITEDVS